MPKNLSHALIAGLSVGVLLGAVAIVLQWRPTPAKGPPADSHRPAAEVQSPAQHPAPARVEQPTEAPPPTIASSGEILGVSIGMPMEEARQKLDPLRAPGPAYEPDAKEVQGRRVLWRLKETEYAWVMVWAGGDGKVTRVRATLRPGNTKPFAEVGDLTTAVAADASSARWNLRGAEGPNYRLIAQGADQRASSVYMFSLEMPLKERQEDGAATEQP